MPVPRLDADELVRVLRDLGDRLDWPTEVEIVLVGGAAGILTGELRRRLTSDCDISLHVPKEAWGELPAFPATASTGEGVLETFRELLCLLYRSLDERHDLRRKFGVSEDEFLKGVFSNFE